MWGIEWFPSDQCGACFVEDFLKGDVEGLMVQSFPVSLENTKLGWTLKLTSRIPAGACINTSWLGCIPAIYHVSCSILTYFDVPGISIASCCDGYTVSPIVNGIFNQFCFVWSKHVEGGIIPKKYCKVCFQQIKSCSLTTIWVVLKWDVQEFVRNAYQDREMETKTDG